MLPMKRILLIDDDPFERTEVPNDLREFLSGDVEVTTAADAKQGIAEFQRLVQEKLHAVLLDFILDEGSMDDSIPLYRQMLNEAPDVASSRVALRTSSREEHVRQWFQEAGVPFPPKYLGKGELREMLDWINALPAQPES